MRRKIAVICGAVLLAVVLLGGCSSVASGTVRTTAAVEVSQETKTAEPAENSDTTQESVDSKTGGEKPHVVLQQNETESSEAETGSADPYADLLKDPEVMAANKIYVKETAETGKTRIIFGGRYPVRLPLRDHGIPLKEGAGDRGWNFRGSLIHHAERRYLYGKQRISVYDGRSATAGKKFTFRADPKYASWLFDMGADLVSLANNHAYDYGEVSLTDTLDTLEAIGMPYVGAGRNLDEAVKPVSFIANGRKITFVSATQIERTLPPDTKGATETTPGVFRCLEINKLLEVISAAKADSDFVIVYTTGGRKELISWITGSRSRRPRSRRQERT